MIIKISEPDVRGEIWDIYMCTEESEVLEIKKTAYNDYDESNESVNKFEYRDFEDRKVCIALCRTLCSSVFEQVYGYCRSCGCDFHFDQILRIIKTFNE